MNKLYALVLFTWSLTCGAQQIDSTKYHWHLSDIYTDLSAWNTALDAFSKKEYLDESLKVIDNSDKLLKFLQKWTELLVDQNPLGAYLHLRSISDNDFNPEPYQGKLWSVTSEKFSKIGSIVAQLSKDKATLSEYFQQDVRLAPYENYLFNLIGNGSSNDSIVAKALDVLENYKSYNVLYDQISSLINYPQITLENGDLLQIEDFTDFRQYQNRSDREKIYKEKTAIKMRYSDLYATLYADKIGHLKATATLEGSDLTNYILDQQNLPLAYYDTLIAVLNDNLDVHYRYLDLMRQLLNIDTLKSWDLEVIPVFEGETYPINKGLSVIKKALSPFGKDYIETIDLAINNNWIDIQKKLNSRSFANYVSGVHPFVSVVYDNSYNQLRSLAHELGHCIEYSLSSEKLPYPIFFLPTFLVEVPSNVNETLLNSYLIEQNKTSAKDVLLNSLFYLNGSLFSTAMNAEVEYLLFKQGETPRAITTGDVKNTYLKIRAKYFGAELGISSINDHDLSRIGDIWYIKDYYRFRWFTYSMGVVITANIKEGLFSGRITPEDYLKFITSGETKSSVELLSELGIDLSDRKSYQPIFDEINKQVEQLQLLTEK